MRRRKLSNLREFHERNRDERNRRQNERYARLVALAAQAKAGVIATITPKGKPGRKREDEHNKTYWLIGEQVEKEIPSHLKRDKLAIMAARRSISEKSKGQYSYDLVAQYHKEFRLTRSKNAAV